MPRILIVEDEDIIRSAVRKLLQHAGYEVADAVSVEEAEGLDPDSFDLVITDLRLPGAAGTEMINRAPNTPVLIMTSYASLRSAVDSMKMGAVDYIAKPFDHDEMLAAVENILARKSSASDEITGPGDAARTSGPDSDPSEIMFGQCEPMQKVFTLI
ncbi:MAG: response regulator, partial [Marinobacter sp.]|nr:response regulator [Marinobacter sp.]